MTALISRYCNLEKSAHSINTFYQHQSYQTNIVNLQQVMTQNDVFPLRMFLTT